MKKLLALLVCCLTAGANAQTFPVNNLTVAGTAAFSGASSFSFGPTMPTATLGTSTTQGATTAFVQNALSASGFAPIFSPVFTGIPSAPTPAIGANSTQIATTAFVVNHDHCTSILDFGGNNGGTGDNTAAFAATIASEPSGQKCVYFPPGKYRFTSQASYTVASPLDSITIEGQGAEKTVLFWPNAQGLAINVNGTTNLVHIRGLSFTTGLVNTGTAILINQLASSIPSPNATISDISNVVIRGDDGFNVADYWLTGIEINGVSGYNFIGNTIYGASTSAGQGVYIHGSSATPPVVFNFIGGIMNWLSVGLNYGNYTQGVSMTAMNMGPVGAAVFSNSGQSNTQSQLSITNGQFWCTSVCINLGTFIAPMNISNNLFEIAAGATGFLFNPGALFSITGNEFLGLNSNTSNVGINIPLMTSFNNQGSGNITGNQFFGLNQGIVLGASSFGVTIGTNSFANINSANIANSAGSANTVGALADFGSTYHNQTGSRVFGTTYTNSTGKPMLVSVWGTSNAGAQLQAVVNGTAIAQSTQQNTTGTFIGFTFVVPQGATYSVTVGAGAGTLSGWFELF